MKRKLGNNAYSDSFKQADFRCNCTICLQQQKVSFDEKIVFPELIEINHTKMKTNQTELKRKALAKTDWEEVL